MSHRFSVCCAIDSCDVSYYAPFRGNKRTASPSPTSIFPFLCAVGVARALEGENGLKAWWNPHRNWSRVTIHQSELFLFLPLISEHFFLQAPWRSISIFRGHLSPRWQCFSTRRVFPTAQKARKTHPCFKPSSLCSWFATNTTASLNCVIQILKIHLPFCCCHSSVRTATRRKVFSSIFQPVVLVEAGSKMKEISSSESDFESEKQSRHEC